MTFRVPEDRRLHEGMLFDPDWVNSKFIALLVWNLNKGYFQALLRLWLYISGETLVGYAGCYIIQRLPACLDLYHCRFSQTW